VSLSFPHLAINAVIHFENFAVENLKIMSLLPISPAFKMC
jgi:hypothetical protein